MDMWMALCLPILGKFDFFFLGEGRKRYEFEFSFLSPWIFA